MVLGVAMRLGIFARPQEAVEIHGGELADRPPVLFRELWRSWHFHELKEDGGVDGPYSVGSRICSGKGTQEVTDRDVSLLSTVPQAH